MAEELEKGSVQLKLEIFDNPITIPAHKLDADQYSADDLDGVTESLFGSGNMAYASLQSSLTDAVLSAVDPNSIVNGDNFSFVNGQGGNAAANNGLAPLDIEPLNNRNDEVATDTDRGVEEQTLFNAPSGTDGAGSFSSSTVGSISASELSSDEGVFAPAGSGLSIQEALDGLDGIDGETPEVTTPTNGSDGSDGNDGGTTVGGGDTNIVINYGDINIDLGDLTLLLDETFINLGNTINDLTTSVTDITNVLGDFITNLDISNLTDLTQVTNIVNELTVNITETVNTTITNVTNLTNNVTNLIETILGGDGDLALNLDLNVLDTGILGVNVPYNNILDTDVNLAVDLAPSVNFLNNIAELTGLDVLSDSLAELGGTVAVLQNTINQVTDLVTDLDLNDPGATVDQLVETLENLDETVSDITVAVDDALGGILESVGIGEELDVLDDIIGDTDLGAILDNPLDLGGDGVGDLDGIVSEIVDPVVNEVTDIVDELSAGALGDVTDDVDALVDDVTDIADELLGDSLGGILGAGNDGDTGDDTDVALGLGLGEGSDANVDGAVEEVLDVALDPVEDLIGDVDLNIDGVLLGDGEIDNNAGDSDVTVDTGIDLVDNTLLAEGLDVPLDPVEEIVGDIDLDVDLALDILGQQADPLIDAADGGSEEDNVLSEIGNGLSEVVGGVLSGDGDAAQEGVEQIVDAVGDLDQELEELDVLDDIIGDTDLGAILDNPLDLGGDGVGDLDGIVSEIVDPVVNEVTDIVDELSAGALGDVTDDVDALVDDVTDIADELLGDSLGGILGAGNDGDTGDDTDVALGLGLGEGSDANVDGAVEEVLDVALDPVEDLIGDVDLNIDGVLLGDGEIDNNAGDSDVTVDTGIDLVDNTLLAEGLDVPLDPVEEIVGDIDLDVDLALDILGQQADPLIDAADGGSEEDNVLSEIGNGLSEVVGGVLSGDGDAAQEGVEQIVDAVGDIDDLAQELGLNLDDIGGGETQSSLVSDTLDPVIEDLGDVVDDLTSGQSEEITDGVNTLADNITDVADALTGGLTEGLLGDANDNQAGEDSDLVADLGLDIVDNDIVDAALDPALDPVEDVVGDLDLDVLGDIDLLNNQGSDNDAGDSDISSLADLEVADTELLSGDNSVTLDPVEQVIGDVDLDVNAVTDVLGNTADDLLNAGDEAQEDLSLDGDIDVLGQDVADIDTGSVLDPVEEIVGDIDSALGINTDLLNNQNTDNAEGDTDITGGIDVDLLGADVVDVPLDAPIDELEQITGDIDLNLDVALDLLNSENPENQDATEDDEMSWTESTLDDAGGLFGDIVNGTDGLGDALPDPVGTIAEGLGALDVEPELDLGSIGGLFG